MSLSYKMLGKSGSMEDRSATNRIALGKRWKMSRHNMEVFQACGEDTRSTSLALRNFREVTVNTRRKIWYNGISRQIYKMKDMDLRV